MFSLQSESVNSHAIISSSSDQHLPTQLISNSILSTLAQIITLGRDQSIHSTLSPCAAMVYRGFLGLREEREEEEEEGMKRRD